MLFLTLCLVPPISFIIGMCSSKVEQGSSKINQDPLKSSVTKGQKHQEHKKFEEVTALQKTAFESTSVLTAIPIKTSPKDKKKAETIKNSSLILNKSKEGGQKKKTSQLKSHSKDSNYAGIQEKPEEKPPTIKLPSVMTIPSKEPTTAPNQEVPKDPHGEINDKSDDTMENIPSVKTKEGVSYEGDSCGIVSPAGTKEDGKPKMLKSLEEKEKK